MYDMRKSGELELTDEMVERNGDLSEMGVCRNGQR